MSNCKEHQLTVGQNAMQQVYGLFEDYLYSTYSYILGKLFSRGVLGQKLMYRIRNTADPDRAFHMLLDHLCEQDSDNLQLLVEVLRDSGTKECLPGHTMLAEELESHLNDAEKDAVGTSQAPLRDLDENHCSSDVVNIKSESNPICLPTSVQATTEQSSTIVCGAESSALWEYPKLMSSLLYFFDDESEEDESTKLIHLSPHHQTSGLTKSVHTDLKREQGVCASPSHGMPLISFAGPLRGRTHGDLVILLWRLGGSNPKKCNLAYQLIRGKKQQLPIDLQIINVLGAVYATSDNAHLFEEALEWTKRPDCLNPVYLQCRLYYLLSICTLGSDKSRSEQYLKQAQELSVMCEPDYITALIAMQEARTILFRVEEHHDHLDEEILMRISNISDRACEISRTLPVWMQPFAMVVTLLKMQLDARIALLLAKSGNRLGAIAAVSPLSYLLRDVEKPDTLCQLIPRQRATYHYTKTVIHVINRDREAAMTNAIKGRNLYLKVNSVEPAHKIMEIVDDVT